MTNLIQGLSVWTIRLEMYIPLPTQKMSNPTLAIRFASKILSYVKVHGRQCHLSQVKSIVASETLHKKNITNKKQDHYCIKTLLKCGAKRQTLYLFLPVHCVQLNFNESTEIIFC